MFHVNERFLRHIWRKQYLKPLGLVTIDGETVEIQSAGEQNQDAGPDFLNAKIRISGVTMTGDVELHGRNSDWDRHRHTNDAKYNRVILHVVLYNDSSSDAERPRTKSGRVLPVLCLERFLDDSFRAVWDRSITDDRVERKRGLACRDSFHVLSEDETADWLSKLARERMELKIRKFEGRLKELIDEDRMTVKEPRFRYFGNPDEIPIPNSEYSQHDFKSRWIWGQVMYEGIFEALGYSKNKLQFLKLSRAISLNYLREKLISPENDCSIAIRAFLYGAAGFLTSDADIPAWDDLFHMSGENDSEKFKRKIIRWWIQNEKNYTHERLLLSEWTFFRLRPNNFPTKRLAAGASLVEKMLRQEIMQDFITIFRSETSPRRQHKALHEYFCSTERRTQQTERITFDLLGHNRINEIIINVLIPVLLLYVRIFRDIDLRMILWNYYGEISMCSQHQLVRFMIQQIPYLKPYALKAFGQQALIQLHHFGCEENRCSDCLLQIKRMSSVS